MNELYWKHEYLTLKEEIVKDLKKMKGLGQIDILIEKYEKMLK